MKKDSSTQETRECFPIGSLWINREWKDIRDPSEKEEFSHYNWCCAVILGRESEEDIRILLENGSDTLWNTSHFSMIWERV